MRHYEHASGRVDLIIGFIDVEVGQSSAVWRSALRAEVKLTAVLKPQVTNCERCGTNRHTERLVKNETRLVYESSQNRRNLFARMEMERLQFGDATVKKF